MTHTEFLVKISEAVSADKKGRDLNIADIGRVLKGIQTVNRESRCFNFLRYLLLYVNRR